MVVGSCLFKSYPNIKLQVALSDIIETTTVKGAPQCKYKCRSHSEVCAGINLKYSKETSNFICELFRPLIYNKTMMNADMDSTLMIWLGKFMLINDLIN